MGAVPQPQPRTWGGRTTQEAGRTVSVLTAILFSSLSTISTAAQE